MHSVYLFYDKKIKSHKNPALLESSHRGFINESEMWNNPFEKD